jgi:PAS domain S-box-containing protein
MTDAASHPIRILMVEGHPADVRLTQEALRGTNVRNVISVAKDGIEALQILRRQGPHADAPRPDVILLDLSLPRPDGREVLEEIRQDETLQRIPIVVLTTSPADEELLRSYRLRAKVVLTAVEQLTAGVDRIGAEAFDVVLENLGLPDSTGLETFERLAALAPRTPIVVLTGVADEYAALGGVRLGTQDYLVKGQVDGEVPYSAVRYAMERREAARALRESEQRYRLVTSTVRDAIITIGAESRVVFANPAAQTLFGYSHDELIGRSQFDLIPPRLHEPYGRALEQYRATGQPGVSKGLVDTIALRRDGTEFPVEIRLGHVEERGVQLLTGVIRDVTERRGAEGALRESEARYHALFDGAPVGLYRSLPDGTLLDVNPMLVELLRAENREALLRVNARDLYVDTGDRERWQEEMDRGDAVVGFEARLRSLNGETIWVRETARRIRQPDGLPAYYAGALFDIGVRKRAEADLLASERRLQTLFETVKLIVIGLGADGRIEYVNPFFVELTGYTRDEIVGRPFLELMPPSIREQRRAVFQELMHEEAHHHTRSAILTKAGAERLISWHNSVVRDADGRPSGTLSVGEDVTEHTQLEEQFRQAQKLEAVGRLAGGVAHDFNNLLAVIQINADLVADPSPGKLDSVRDAIQDIRHAAEQGAVLTRQLLAFSRRQIVAPRSLNLYDVVSNTERLLRRLVGEDITLAVKVEPGLGAVMADPAQIEQVVMNLAVNARDAMPHGGRLTIDLANVELDEAYAELHRGATPGPHVQLTVSDTGFGMDRETQSRIFEPFFTTKELGRGTGLGLSTVFGIVQQSGGSIGVYSEPGHGATFKVYLPRLAAGAVAARLPTTMPEPRGGAETILVVEDEDGLRRLTQRTLERQGYTVLTASNGATALEVAARHGTRIALVVSDVVMPGMGGRLLVAELRKRQPGIRVLFTSGYTTDEVVRRGVMTSEVPFLPKPFGIGDLTRKVREVLDAPEPV